jgi:GT2 family glycosyltransferase
MNNDFIQVAGALKQLVAVLESDPEIGAVQGTILSTDGYLDNCGFCKDELLQSWPARVSRTPHEVTYTAGCFSIYRMSAIARICGDGSLFNTDLFAYDDDATIGMKLWNAGFKCICTGFVTGHHSGGASFRENTAFQDYLLDRAWLARLAASNSKYRVLGLLMSGRLVLAGIIKAIIRSDVRDILYSFRAWVHGIRIGRKLIAAGDILDIYSAPVKRTSMLDVVLVKISKLVYLYLRRGVSARARKGERALTINSAPCDCLHT